jgi:hypothetical protein
VQKVEANGQEENGPAIRRVELLMVVGNLPMPTRRRPRASSTTSRFTPAMGRAALEAAAAGPVAGTVGGLARLRPKSSRPGLVNYLDHAMRAGQADEYSANSRSCSGRAGQFPEFDEFLSPWQTARKKFGGRLRPQGEEPGDTRNQRPRPAAISGRAS